MSIYKRLLLVCIWVGLITAFSLMLLVGYWLLNEYRVVNVEQPLEILNANDTIKIGQPIELGIDYDKFLPLEATIYPSVQCKSGSLATLVSRKSNLPVGKHTVISTTYLLPPQVLVGDQCKVVLTQTYRVNPIRVVTYVFYSEYFIVAELIK